MWDPRDLAVCRGWFEDGPLLPIEFARESSGQRITLVLVEGARPVRSLWGLMSTSSLGDARESLRAREGIRRRNLEKHVGYWTVDGNSGGIGIDEIGPRAERLGLDAVIWTALPASFNDEETRAGEVVAHLRSLGAEGRRNAEEYVRRAPRQIDPDVRRRLEVEFGWTPIARTSDG